MSISPVSICNMALLEIGCERIISLDDDSKRAIICKELYENVRDYVLVSHPWIFAMKRIELAQIDEDVPFEFNFQYQLPSDCLMVTKIEGSPDYKIEGDRLLTNATNVKIKYIRRITDCSKYTPNFSMAVSYIMAVKICYPLIQSREMVDDLKQSYLAVIREARSINAQAMGSADDFIVDEFLNSRL